MSENLDTKSDQLAQANLVVQVGSKAFDSIDSQRTQACINQLSSYCMKYYLTTAKLYKSVVTIALEVGLRRTKLQANPVTDQLQWSKIHLGKHISHKVMTDKYLQALTNHGKATLDKYATNKRERERERERDVELPSIQTRI